MDGLKELNSKCHSNSEGGLVGWIDGTVDLSTYMPTTSTYILTHMYVMSSQLVESYTFKGKRFGHRPGIKSLFLFRQGSWDLHWALRPDRTERLRHNTPLIVPCDRHGAIKTAEFDLVLLYTHRQKDRHTNRHRLTYNTNILILCVRMCGSIYVRVSFQSVVLFAFR